MNRTTMPTLHRPGPAALTLLMLASLPAACGQGESRSTAAGAPGAQAAAAPAGLADIAAKDVAITAAVKARLASDGALGALAIDVGTKQGRVLLRGVTPDTAVRRHAGAVAGSVAGVVEVRNDLSVQVIQR